MRYVVFGSGGMAKEVIGYLESDGHAIDYVVSPEPFNNAAFDYDVGDEYWGGLAVLAVADPAVKRKIVAKYPDAQWDTYIHPSAFISSHSRIGRGCVIAPQAIVYGDPVVEDFCFMSTNATVGHDSRLGAYSTLFPNTAVCGNCDIGEDCILGIGAYVIPGVTLPAGTKVSAGAVVRESIEAPSNIYGDPRGVYRVRPHKQETM